MAYQWIPGHSDLQGNDRADKLEKEGARKEQINKPPSSKTVKQILRTNSWEAWLNRWCHGNKGRVMYRGMSGPTSKNNISFLTRPECYIPNEDMPL